MYQATITEREAGQRFDKYLQRILPNAGSGFLHKMLRKKNITLNDKKAEGSEKLAHGDCVKIFLRRRRSISLWGKHPGTEEKKERQPTRYTFRHTRCFRTFE